MPTDDHLRRRLAPLLGDRGDDGIIENLPVAERRIGLHPDAVALMVVPDVALLEIWMRLELVHGRDDTRLPDDPVEVVDEEVGNADAAREAILLRLDQPLLRLDVVFAS